MLFLPLCGLGVTVLFGGFSPCFLYEGQRGRKQAVESMGWSEIAATIVEAHVETNTNYSEHGPSVSYAPAVHYSYIMRGEPFTGDKISFGLPAANG